MYKRVIVGLLVLLAMGTGACGGDDDSAASVSDSCTPMTQSMPGTMGDPCPQTADKRPPTCPAETFSAIATCDTNGTWKKGPDGAIACACVAKGGAAGAGGGTMPKCGDGKIEGMEQCDYMGATSFLNNSTCAKLIPGSEGVLGCSQSTCRYDTTMCVSKAPTSGMGGSGAMMSGVGGAGK